MLKQWGAYPAGQSKAFIDKAPCSPQHASEAGEHWYVSGHAMGQGLRPIRL